MKPARLALCLVAIIAISFPAYANEPPAADPLAFQQTAWPLLEKHCASCHGPKRQKMGINFADMKDVGSILSRRDLWRKVREVLETEEMPPEPDKTDFKADDRRKLLDWIRDKVEKIDRTSPIYLDPGPTLIRALTRTEYNNTIRDLIGVPFDAARAGGIPEDDAAIEGFLNLAGRHSINEALLQKYFTAADATLKFLFEEKDKDAKNPRLKLAREALFVARPGKDLSNQEAARKVLERFARRAYRRPALAEEIDRLMPIVELALKKGDNFEQAVRKALRPLLVSPYFLYRMEADLGKPGLTAGYWISDNELAVRLSYFLWSTMPDDELFTAADLGVLARADGFDAQVKRMLADPKARALTDNFAVEWLQLNKLQNALPSRNTFPAFQDSLKSAMKQETMLFFEALWKEDRSILELLDANYTYANDELARHYKLPGVKGATMQKVPLRPEDHRGGLLGMASMLALTSHTDRTKPTARGKWILEVVLGTPPAPPPANASTFAAPKDKKAAPKTFRDKLALHASDAACAACHKRVDPLGFALENYDALGVWRNQVDGKPVDNAGTLPTGEKFVGVDGLKKLLQGRQDQFARNMTEQMFTYAMGRTVEYTDELTILKISEELKRKGYRFSTLVHGIVTSRPFQYRKDFAPAPKQP